jgi:hypothetical protein
MRFIAFFLRIILLMINKYSLVQLSLIKFQIYIKFFPTCLKNLIHAHMFRIKLLFII